MRLLLLFIIVPFATLCHAQSVEKRYTNFIGNNGIVYFFYPKKLKKLEGMEKFSYDITCSSKSDTAILNFSIYSLEPAETKKLTMHNGNDSIESISCKTLFVDVEDKGYKTRCSTTFLLSDLKKMYKNKSTLYFKLLLKEGIACKANYRKREWKKESSVITRILNSIY